MATSTEPRIRAPWSPPTLEEVAEAIQLIRENLAALADMEGEFRAIRRELYLPGSNERLKRLVHKTNEHLQAISLSRILLK